jgi:hypothetical protein
MPGGGKVALLAGVAPNGPHRSFLPTVNRCASLPILFAVCRQRRDRVPFRCGLLFHRAWLVKAAQEAWGVVGARLLGLDCHATLPAPHGRQLRRKRG